MLADIRFERRLASASVTFCPVPTPDEEGEHSAEAVGEAQRRGEGDEDIRS